MNFNDLLSSFCTLFALMVVNNWMVITAMYVETMNNAWYEVYFGLFYYFSVVIGINIVVAFAIDMYSSVERLDHERTRTLDILQEELEMVRLTRQTHMDNGFVPEKMQQRGAGNNTDRQKYIQLPQNVEEDDISHRSARGGTNSLFEGRSPAASQNRYSTG